MSALALAGADELLLPPSAAPAQLRHDRAHELLLEGGSVLVDGTRIAELTSQDARAEQTLDCRGCAVIPGFVDCHTHLPFAGWRADEYGRRIAGEPYAAIARAGGGIRRSIGQLRAASDDEVLAASARLADEMLRAGTTSLELKCGYGGDLAGERRHLALARRLARRVEQPAAVTGLLAHSVPDAFTADAWVDEVARELPGLRDSVVALDVFVESFAFGNEHLARMGALAATHGLALRAHVEQFTTHGSVPVALAAGARSVDHLSCLPHEHVPALAAAECAAVLLPAAELLNDEHAAPGRELADAGALCAVATDCNPGTSPVHSMTVVIGLAVRHYRWTIREALLAATLTPAWVLRCADEVGSLEVGKRADLLVLDGPVDHVAYRFGRDPVLAVVAGGRLVHLRPDARRRLATRRTSMA